MPQINLSDINNNIKIGNIVETASDHIMIEYNTDEINDDIIDELVTLLAFGDVDLFDSDGNFYLDSDQIIRTKVSLLKS